jgi:hypothetical protein
MYDDCLVHNWELASVIYEQSRLASKATILTPQEKRLFQVLDTRMEQLLSGSINGPLNRREQWRTPIVSWIYLN